MRIQPITYYNNSQTYRKPVSFSATRMTTEQANDLKVFFHHIYEYKKGLRSLILTTEKSSNRDVITGKLERNKIPYVIQEVSDKKINVFFGNEDCISVVKTFDENLSKLSPEKDFMLGIMLGYDKILQCQRYLKRLGMGLNSQKG